MQLSVIIVNYNVRYFLEQCLYTVLRASAGLEVECTVVDNGSSDGSMDYLKPLFPTVRFIENGRNWGFAKANNQALPFCQGKYVLFLNPDTLVPENGLRNCLAYMQQQPAAGALGVRMIDGRGRFLPESKRSLPSPLTAFYKLAGLAALFPRSGVFNRYALGNLDEHANHRVEVLAGACMLVKRNLLLQLKGFDERYFLYGEDIDLSYRISKAGFENHYFAGTTLIHFKGESSGNNSLIHVKHFYEAMLVFVRKHYQTGEGKLLAVFLQVAIGMRAAVSALNRLLKPYLWPLIDGAITWLCLQGMRIFWIKEFRNGKDFGVDLLPYVLPAFPVLFVAASAFAGMYDLRTRISQMFSSLAFAILAVLAVYSLLPETIRFSRGVMLWGTLLATLWILFLRKVFYRSEKELSPAALDDMTIVVASERDQERLFPLLEKEMIGQPLQGRISPQPGDMKAAGCLQELPALADKLRFGRIIFCIGDLVLQEVIPVMQVCRKQHLRFLFHVSGSQSMVGSQALAPGSSIITPEISYAISQPHQKRMKRIVDLLFSLVFLITLPIHLFLQPQPARFLINIFQVLTGKKTWVGYASAVNRLPQIRKAVISSVGDPLAFPEVLLQKTDSHYARNYDWWEDIPILLRFYRQLGGRTQ